MKKITINSSDAKLSHLNMRTEGAKEDPTRAVDLKFEAVLPSSVLSALLGTEAPPPFWNADGAVQYIGITSFATRTELEGCQIEFGDLALSKITLTGAKVNKFVFVPVQGHAMKCSLRVQLAPSDEELLALSHALLKTAELHIEAVLGYTGDNAGDLGDDMFNAGDDGDESDGDGYAAH